jgi:phenylalanyl-tRNA synthetase beta chain
MKAPLSWLAEFVDLKGLSPENIAQGLTLRSVETSVGVWEQSVEGVVFGKVLKVENHPQKQELKVCKVDVGDVVQVVTRDQGIKEGDGVLVGLPGARVGDRVISKRDFFGVVSEGMLLSAQELGLEDSSQGVLVIEEKFSPGTPAKEVLGFGEYVLEVEITPNRGDLLSILGLAREISALFDLPLKDPQDKTFEDFGSVEVHIEDPDCKRYRAVLIEGVQVKPSPLWLRRRLWQCGIKSINNVVDITNYVMLERGQPLHAFDWEKIEGPVVIRRAKKGEKINTLMGVEKELSEENLVIADGEKVLALGGVVGGSESGVREHTKSILLEGAYFEPFRVRRSAKSLGVQTESSYRFERNVDIQSLKKHQDRAVGLILQLAGGEVRAVKDIYPQPYEPKRIFLSFGKFKRYAGEELDPEGGLKVLQKLGFEVRVQNCGFEVLVPAFRSFDVQGDADIVEELLRVKGYDNLQAERLLVPSKPKVKDKLEREIKNFLKARGFFEVLNFSFEGKRLYETLGLKSPTLEIINPLVKEERFLRTSLIPSLINSYLRNRRKFIQQIAIFEVSKVFFEEGEGKRLGILSNMHTLQEFRSLVSDLLHSVGVLHTSQGSKLAFLHPNLQVSLWVEGEEIGFLGLLNPLLERELDLKEKILIAELDLDKLKPKKAQYMPFSNYPPVVRDITLVMDKGLSVDKLIMHIRKLEEVEDLKVVSVWTDERVLGEGKKSVSFRLFLRSLKGSLSDEEANQLVFGLVEDLKREFGVSLR